MNQGRG